ncbi:AbrB/MazE/SpoVT family DNA-binding domain-containing protein [bacterium]|nr:AbrB/MazE/SpoVT family DNA-binding domain-containing protein [bacterium]
MTMAVSLQISQSGAVILPARVRRKYGLLPGDRLLIEDFGNALVLRAAPSRVDASGDRIEAARKSAGLAVADLLEGLDEQRIRYNEERRGTGPDH